MKTGFQKVWGFLLLAGALLCNIPLTAKHGETLLDDTIRGKVKAPETSSHVFKMHGAAAHQEIKALKTQPKEPLRPLLPFVTKKASLNASYKGLPYGSGPTSSSGSFKSKKAKMIVVRVNSDGSTDDGSGDEEDDEGSDDEEDDEEEEDPYLKVKILERKRLARIEEERVRGLNP